MEPEMVEYDYRAHYAISGAAIYDGAWMEDPETHHDTRSFSAPDDFKAKDIAESYFKEVGERFLGRPTVRLEKLERLVQTEKAVSVPLKV